MYGCHHREIGSRRLETNGEESSSVMVRANYEAVWTLGCQSWIESHMSSRISRLFCLFIVFREYDYTFNEAQKQARAEDREDIQILRNAAMLVHSNPTKSVEILHTKAAQANMQIQQRNQELNLKRQQDIAFEQAERETELRNQILKENPAWQHTHDEKCKRIKEATDKMYSLAERFYKMTPQQLREYTNYRHRPEVSAVKHLLLEDSRGKFVIYECKYCGDKSHTPGEFETHCYLRNKEGHREANLDKIRNEVRQGIAKEDEELDKLVYTGIQANQKKELRARLDKERREQYQKVKDLPYAKQ